MVGQDAVSPTTHLQVSHSVFYQCQMMCHPLPSAAAPQELPCQLGWEQLVQLEHQAHHTEQNQQPRQCLSCDLIDIQECNTPSRDAKQSKHAITTPEVHETAGELVDMGYCDSQKHGCSIAWHHREASISLTTKKRPKGITGEMNALCLPVPYVYTQPPLADSCPRHSPGLGAFCLTATDAMTEIMGWKPLVSWPRQKQMNWINYHYKWVWTESEETLNVSSEPQQPFLGGCPVLMTVRTKAMDSDNHHWMTSMWSFMVEKPLTALQE